MFGNEFFGESLFEDFFNGFFGNARALQGKGLTQEVIEFEKKGVHTKITLTFNDQGYLVGIRNSSEYNPSESEIKLNQLQLDLKKAVDEEDYLAAAVLKKKISELEKKPTK